MPIIALVVSALAMLSVPMAVRRMIDKGFGGNDSALINNYFLTLIGIGLIIAIASPARFYFVNWIGERVVADLRTKVFAQLAKLGPAYFDLNHSGEMMSRLTADTTQIKTVAGSALSQAARNLIMLIGALDHDVRDERQALGARASSRFRSSFCRSSASAALCAALSRYAQDTLGDASAYAAENLAAYRTMQAYVNEKTVSDRFGARRRARFRRGASTYAGARGVDGNRDLSDGRQRHRRSLVRRLRRHRRRHDRWHGSVSSSSTRCSRPARSPSFRRFGAKSARRLARPSGFPR